MSCRSILQLRLSQHLSNISVARRRTLEDNDPEGLHDLRVAIRGLRAILPLLSKKKAMFSLRARWQAFARATGPSRDMEVLLELLAHLPDVPEAVHRHVMAVERKTRNELCHLLASAELPLLLQHSRRILSNPKVYPATQAMSQRGRRRADKLAKSIQRQILALGHETHAGDWHALRLTIKRLRYLIEHGAEWLPKTWGMAHPALKQCQTALGNLHDLDMLHEQTSLEIRDLRDAKETVARDAVNTLASFIGTEKHRNKKMLKAQKQG